MSLINKIKKLFTGNSEDELFIPVEYTIRHHTKKSENKETEYVNDLLNNFEPPKYEQHIEEKQQESNNDIVSQEKQEDESYFQPYNEISYSIKRDIGDSVASRYNQRICIYLYSKKFNKRQTSIKTVEGCLINQMPHNLKLIGIEQELNDLFNKHTKTFNIEIPTEKRLEILSDLRKEFDI